jgi:Domain of unknown function (DUF4919)
MRALCVAVLVLLLTGFLPAAAADEGSYDMLLAQLKTGNTAIDFTALRYARAEQPGYNPYEALSDPAKGDLIRAMASNDQAAVATLANQLIERDYTDIDAHAALAAVLERRGERQQAAFELAVANGLLRSIRDSGDGMTAETAYVVIGVAEEYSFLGAVGVQVARQSLVQSARGPVDALEVVNPANGERQTVYFDVSRLFNAMARLGGTQKAP